MCATIKILLYKSLVHFFDDQMVKSAPFPIVVEQNLVCSLCMTFLHSLDITTSKENKATQSLFKEMTLNSRGKLCCSRAHL